MTKTTETRRIPTDPREYAAMIRMAERAAYQYEQEREEVRAIEDKIMANPLDYNPGVVAQIRDHRENGNHKQRGDRMSYYHGSYDDGCRECGTTDQVHADGCRRSQPHTAATPATAVSGAEDGPLARSTCTHCGRVVALGVDGAWTAAKVGLPGRGWECPARPGDDAYGAHEPGATIAYPQT